MKTQNLLLLALGAAGVYYWYNRSKVTNTPHVLPPNTNPAAQTTTQTLQANVTTLQSNVSPYGNAAPTNDNIIDFLTQG